MNSMESDTTAFHKTRRQVQLVNLGCGATYHPDWVNMDVEPRASEIRRWDVRVRLPFDDGSIDAVYTSHLVEHLAPDDLVRLLRDICRVIRTGGIVRIVAPDLESICRAYLTALGEAWTGLEGASARYDWMIIELVDQMARSKGGGEMGAYLERVPPEERAFIVSRIGMEAESFWADTSRPMSKRILARLREKGFGWALARGRRRLAEWIVRLVGGHEAGLALREGVFRRAGEVHRWMYDRYSLRRLLQEVGFSNFALCDAWTSSIPFFSSYQLDAIGERVRKPDSIFVEACKP
jgi:predicted SAM-dependent methyltransferase